MTTASMYRALACFMSFGYPGSRFVTLGLLYLCPDSQGKAFHFVLLAGV